MCRRLSAVAWPPSTEQTNDTIFHPSFRFPKRNTGIALSIQSGTIGSLGVTVPWRLWEESCIVRIDRVRLTIETEVRRCEQVGVVIQFQRVMNLTSHLPPNFYSINSSLPRREHRATLNLSTEARRATVDPQRRETLRGLRPTTV